MRPVLPCLLLAVACTNMHAATMAVGSVHEVDLEQLTFQATTLQEAETFLGQPVRSEGLKNGSLILSYSLADPWNQGGEVLLFFDPAHVLAGRAYVEDAEDQEKT